MVKVLTKDDVRRLREREEDLPPSAALARAGAIAREIEPEIVGDYSPTCLFPFDHESGHPAGMRFRVLGVRDQAWEDLTEPEIYERRKGEAFTASSQFDCWWDDLGIDLYHVEDGLSADDADTCEVETDDADDPEARRDTPAERVARLDSGEPSLTCGTCGEEISGAAGEAFSITQDPTTRTAVILCASCSPRLIDEYS